MERQAVETAVEALARRGFGILVVFDGELFGGVLDQGTAEKPRPFESEGAARHATLDALRLALAFFEDDESFADQVRPHAKSWPS